MAEGENVGVVAARGETLKNGGDQGTPLSNPRPLASATVRRPRQEFLTQSSDRQSSGAARRGGPGGGLREWKPLAEREEVP